MAVLVPQIGVTAACAAVGRSRSTYYRRYRESSCPSQQLPGEGWRVTAADESVTQGI
ncbi:hypothetical protein [Protofrankia coriariae]|uniref:Uncharacterized protein n=1 Tax=Candidatus Protofrankia datiscae TaxID=2716812 RepID=F8AY71_9ACTN|nr:hypothetical protein [Protofrankia coriariae]AEH09501.1 hypothetical protein FsymDg_2078 [Candidatus Protofrankia datiscae]